MRPQIVVVGAPLDGFPVLRRLLAGLMAKFPAPVVIAQHRARGQDDGLLELLRGAGRLPIMEPEDKEDLAPGRAYLAPRDYHLLVEKGSLALSLESPIRGARPSIDALFESAADAYGGRVIGVMLGPGGGDGAQGLAKIRSRGGLTVAQEPAAAADRVLPPERIALFLNGLWSAAVI